MLTLNIGYKTAAVAARVNNILFKRRINEAQKIIVVKALSFELH